MKTCLILLSLLICAVNTSVFLSDDEFDNNCYKITPQSNNSKYSITKDNDLASSSIIIEIKLANTCKKSISINDLKLTISNVKLNGDVPQQASVSLSGTVWLLVEEPSINNGNVSLKASSKSFCFDSGCKYEKMPENSVNILKVRLISLGQFKDFSVGEIELK